MAPTVGTISALTPSEIELCLEHLFTYPADVKTPALFLWGGPGIGKSAICRKIAQKLERQFGELKLGVFKNMDAASALERFKGEVSRLIDFRLAQCDPSDVRGIPIPDRESRAAEWLIPMKYPRQKGPGIFLLDELPLAPPLVQSAAYQLIHDRRLDEYTVPEGWIMLAAGNDREHNSGSYKLSHPLHNRFIHIEYLFDLEELIAWALKNGVAEEVVGFLRFRPELAYKFDPKTADKAFPTPRTWEMVSNVMKHGRGLPEKIVLALIAGAVGSGAATEFSAFLRVHRELPDVEKILDGTLDYRVPAGKPDIAFALVGALATRAKTGQHFERLIGYSEKFGAAEWGALLMKMLARKDSDTLTSCKSFPKWAEKNSDLFLGFSV